MYSLFTLVKGKKTWAVLQCLRGKLFGQFNIFYFFFSDVGNNILMNDRQPRGCLFLSFKCISPGRNVYFLFSNQLCLNSYVQALTAIHFNKVSAQTQPPLAPPNCFNQTKQGQTPSRWQPTLKYVEISPLQCTDKKIYCAHDAEIRKQ